MHEVTSMMTLDEDLYISKYEEGNYFKNSDFCIDRFLNFPVEMECLPLLLPHFRHSKTHKLIAVTCDRCKETEVSIRIN